MIFKKRRVKKESSGENEAVKSLSALLDGVFSSMMKYEKAVKERLEASGQMKVIDTGPDGEDHPVTIGITDTWTHECHRCDFDAVRVSGGRLECHKFMTDGEPSDEWVDFIKLGIQGIYVLMGIWWDETGT